VIQVEKVVCHSLDKVGVSVVELVWLAALLFYVNLLEGKCASQKVVQSGGSSIKHYSTLTKIVSYRQGAAYLKKQR